MPLLNALICKFSNTFLHSAVSLPLTNFFAASWLVLPFWLDFFLFWHHFDCHEWVTTGKLFLWPVIAQEQWHPFKLKVNQTGTDIKLGHPLPHTLHLFLKHWALYQFGDKHGANWKRRQHFAKALKWRWFHWQFRWWISANGPGKNGKITSKRGGVFGAKEKFK